MNRSITFRNRSRTHLAGDGEEDRGGENQRGGQREKKERRKKRRGIRKTRKKRRGKGIKAVVILQMPIPTFLRVQDIAS